MRTLPERTRRVLLLRVLVGLSAQETGRMTGMTEVAVRTTQHRALKRLRRDLAPHRGMPPDPVPAAIAVA